MESSKSDSQKYITLINVFGEDINDPGSFVFSQIKSIVIYYKNFNLNEAYFSSICNLILW